MDIIAVCRYNRMFPTLLPRVMFSFDLSFQRHSELGTADQRLQLRDAFCMRQVRDVNTAMLADLMKFWQVNPRDCELRLGEIFSPIRLMSP